MSGSSVAPRTVFVRNLPYAATARDLETLFADVGPLKTCFVVTDPATKQGRGFGCGPGRGACMHGLRG